MISRERLSYAPTGLGRRFILPQGLRLGLHSFAPSGAYHLIEYAADPRGGVYFVTGQGGDGSGPDTTSYGFVYQPNSQGSPFGRKYYNPVHLFGDWYMFEASDDF